MLVLKIIHPGCCLGLEGQKTVAAQRFHPARQGSVPERESSMGIFALGGLPELGLQDAGPADDCSIAPIAPQAQSRGWEPTYAYGQHLPAENLSPHLCQALRAKGFHEGCLPQAFLCFWKLSAVIVLFSVAKIWETCVVLSILVFGLLRKQSAAQAWRFGRTCPP